jgi:beta-glucosidase
MKKGLLIVVIIILCNHLEAQKIPFRNLGLGEKERIDNLILLMNLDEKLTCLSTRFLIPRLGIKDTRTIEGLHGVAYSGSANWAVKGPKASATTSDNETLNLTDRIFYQFKTIQ